MNNYSSFNTITPSLANSSNQYQTHIKYHYSYPESVRILEQPEKKRPTFLNANNHNTISATAAAAYLNNLNSYHSKQLEEKANMKPPQPPHSVLAHRHQAQYETSSSAAATPIDLKKYGTTNFIGFNKMKSFVPQTPVANQSANSNGNNYLTPSTYSKSRFLTLSQYQAEREKYFAEYIKNNGDAASLIVAPYLYLGGHRSVNNVNNLVAQGITHILNMASELKLDVAEMSKNNIKLLHIPAKDAKTYNIRSDFDKAFHFIDEALKSKGKIIINCARGISRSATIVIGYLMFRYNMRLLDAFNYTVSKRPQVRPNSNFRKQLEIYEQELIYNRYKIQIKAKALGYVTPLPHKLIVHPNNIITTTTNLINNSNNNYMNNAPTTTTTITNNSNNTTINTTNIINNSHIASSKF